jgi:hypothetical protein
MKVIGKVAAVEKYPTTIDEFCFWTKKDLILNPFDVVKVSHINDSTTYGVIEEISHITDTPSYLTSYMSNDFGNVESNSMTNRIGLNFVKAKVVANTENIYNPVLDGASVSLASKEEIMYALGLEEVMNPLPCGYLEMYEYEEESKITLPVHLNSKFLVGPDGAHLNISGISGLAAKTSYAMFLIKAIHEAYLKNNSDESVAFVILNVKGRDLLAIDQSNDDLIGKQFDKVSDLYKLLGLTPEPFKNVKYFFPYSTKACSNTYATTKMVNDYIKQKKGYQIKYTFEDDRSLLDLLFSNIEDSTGTMESICDYIENTKEFTDIRNWNDFLNKVNEKCLSGQNTSKEITVGSWRKFYRIIKKPLNNPIFSNRVVKEENETRLTEAIGNIKKNDVYVIDVSKLGETMQGFVFGDVIRAIYELKLGAIPTDTQTGYSRNEEEIPSKIIIFVDELNKYASNDTPKNSPVLQHLLDIAERGRSLGIILFSAEQFKSDIKDKVKGNCATHAYGRTNAIEISKHDYTYVPSVYKNMMTRLKPGEYIIQNPIFRSLLNIKFPEPIYKQFK